MSRRLIGSVVGALAVAGLAAPVAHAGSPAKVNVRIEAPTRTLVDATLTTTRTPVSKDGDASHTCAGTSAAGAIEQATGGRWTANWADGLGFFVLAFGKTQPTSPNDYWTLWHNGKSSPTGVCDTELEDGDEVLEFICSPTPDFSSCTNRPLVLTGGRGSNSVVNVKVVALNGDGTSVPVKGAVVHGGRKDATTAADGSASVSLGDGQTALHATHTGDVPSAKLSCLFTKPKGDTACGSRDRTPPTLTIKAPRNDAVFAVGDAPRILKGGAKDPRGVTVALRLTRRTASGCTVFDGENGAFRRCPKKPQPLFTVGDRERWSYLLPAQLAVGSYTLQVRATDGAGNATAKTVRFSVAVIG